MRLNNNLGKWKTLGLISFLSEFFLIYHSIHSWIQCCCWVHSIAVRLSPLKSWLLKVHYEKLRECTCMFIFHLSWWIGSIRINSFLHCLFKYFPLLLTCVLARFMSTWYKLESFGKRKSQLRSVGKPVVHFTDCWLMWKGPTHCGQCNLWAGGSERHKKESWTSQEEQSRK